MKELKYNNLEIRASTNEIYLEQYIELIAVRKKEFDILLIY